MSGINKVIVIGRLGQDPEVRYSPNGSGVANFSLAVSENWKDKNTGEKVEKTEWIKAVAFGRLAEIVGEYLHKGSQVYIEGKLQTRKWEDKQGQTRYTTEVVVQTMQMLDSKREAEPRQEPARPEPAPAANPVQEDFDDSDIPF